MKIAGFAQLRNERQKGNLENWMKCMTAVCDIIYIFDQASEDNSQELYKTLGEGKVTVVQSQVNNFSDEVGCKAFLLKALLKSHPDTDYIFWMDGDTYLDNRLLENRDTIRELLSSKFSETDGISMGHYNLWRSDTYFRKDDSYHGLHGGVTAFWRNNGRLFFPENVRGLHQRVIPLGIDKVEGINKHGDEFYSLIHRGFATDYQIITKYDVYKGRGQTGWALDRLLNENELEVEEIPSEILPSWYNIREDNDPTVKTPIFNVYQKLKGVKL
tara:strand:- start:32544 stop:33359 length:816 start_codon:yes stop_codon:yes gene_type:complete